MRKETKTFIVVFYPGSLFPETVTKEVGSIGEKIKLSPRAYGYAYHQCDVINDGKKDFIGEIYNRTSMFFPDGELYDKKRLKDEHGSDSILYRNIIDNGYKYAVKTRRGNYQPLMKGDKVLKNENVIFEAK